MLARTSNILQQLSEYRINLLISSYIYAICFHSGVQVTVEGQVPLLSLLGIRGLTAVTTGTIWMGGWQQNLGGAALWSKPILNNPLILFVQTASRK
jgi:hypothetical protein